jgi:outer membrane murein-binding lipoprotein Lpp
MLSSRAGDDVNLESFKREKMSKKLLIAAVLVSSCFVTGCAEMVGAAVNTDSSDQQILAETAAVLKADEKDVSISIYSNGFAGTIYSATLKSGKQFTKYTCNIQSRVASWKLNNPPQCIAIEQPAGASPFH